MVNFHPNIIKFCGVVEFEDEVNPSLVLEYADGGTLGKYLRDNAATFNWEDQLKFAKEISSAILCLHDNEIIHRDLHSNNILVHQHTVKLAGFGRSYREGSDCNIYIRAHCVIPYTDPKIFNIKETESCDLTKKSDIYSLGVLLWQLTSCSSPFGFETKNDEFIILEILNDKREDPIPGTNDKFVKLYQKCWRYEPDERPDINQVILELNNIDSENDIVSNSEKSDEHDHFSDCDLSKYY